MKYLLYLLLPTLIALVAGCRQTDDAEVQFKIIEGKIIEGDLNAAIRIADSIKSKNAIQSPVWFTADSLSQIAERISIDYSVSEDAAIARIIKNTGNFVPEEKTIWESNGWLEYKMINGKKMYFNRAVSNLLLIRKFHQKDQINNNPIDSSLIFRLLHTESVIKSSLNKTTPAEPVGIKIKYTVSVDADAVPEGEIVRCWLPWPANGNPRQQKIKMTETSQSEYVIAPDTAIHSTIYMESVSVKGKPSVFSVSFTYESSAQYFRPENLISLPYDKNSAIYKKYTAQQLPHIHFSDYIKNLADSISGTSDVPAEIVRNIYVWIKENIPWAGAPEYSIIPDIPGYVYKNRRGDCGMQTFLFMSMLRYKGIPVRWQSGWMIPPNDENLHDWCEVYYEGTGWVPVDVSYQLQDSENSQLKYFYLTGIDSYRLILNNGIAGPLHPMKFFIRSEPYDFQRGEVEWKGGNLYFNKWDYNMEIEYL